MASPFSSYLISPLPTYGTGEGQQQPAAGPSATASGNSEAAATTAPADAQASTSKQPLDYYNYGLDPAAFSTDISFQMPSFLSGPFAQPPPAVSGPSLMDANMLPFAMPTPPGTNVLPRPGSRPSGPPKTTALYSLSVTRPIYGPYGSSIVGVTPDAAPFKAPAPNSDATTKAQGKARAVEAPAFDPTALGLPRAVGGNFPGLYSVSGFDMLGVLARVAARPNPQVNVGPVDLSTAFTVVDARRFDLPIVYASETFLGLTGYSANEVIGRNCRFLQAPPGEEVVVGSTRTHTDSNAVYHMKAHIQSGKESQSSVINYKKDSSPFINLVTIIPIPWESDEVAYYVGFQVDVVNQPNSILERMKNGTYTVNYSLVQSDRSFAENIVTEPQVDAPIPQPQGAGVEAAFRTALHQPPPPRSRSQNVSSVPAPKEAVAEQKLRDLSLTPGATESPVAVSEMLSGLAGMMTPGAGLGGQQDLDQTQSWHQQLVEQSDDLIHILSLKGSFLYVSPSCRRILEYDPNELVGKTVGDVCHPADVVPIMRELKDSANQPTAPGHCISILYRIKRKQSDYVWIEAQGRLHIEQAKGRKCVIFVGRQRPLYSLSRSALNTDGGVGDNEFWAKITFDGMFLHVSPTVDRMLGFSAVDMTGFSIFQLTPDNDPANKELEKALDRARSRLPARVNHNLRNYQGQALAVVTSFYPPLNDGELIQPTYAVVRVCTVDAENSRQLQTLSDTPPNSARRDDLFQPLPPRSSDNLFEELETSRGTNWQFELHALAQANKKMRDERDMLETLLRGTPSAQLPTGANYTLGVPNADDDDEDAASDGSAPLASLPLPGGSLPMARQPSSAQSDDDSMA